MKDDIRYLMKLNIGELNWELYTIQELQQNTSRSKNRIEILLKSSWRSVIDFNRFKVNNTRIKII